MRSWAVAILVGLTALAVACGSSNRLRYKMVVEVELRSGHAVREVRLHDAEGWFALGESRPSVKLVGEAVAVDLPGGRTLFALLRSGAGASQHAARLPERAMGWRQGGVRGPVELWPTAPDTIGLRLTDPVPMLVAFQDTDDPLSVEKVDPDNLAASFGSGFRLRRIFVESANEPVTAAIGERLKWLGPHPEPRLDPTYRSGKNIPLARTLSHGDFRMGVAL